MITHVGVDDSVDVCMFLFDIYLPQGSLKDTHSGGGSNFLQIYGNFEGFPLEKLCIVWVDNDNDPCTLPEPNSKST